MANQSDRAEARNYAEWAEGKSKMLQEETNDPTVKELARVVTWLSAAVVRLSKDD